MHNRLLTSCLFQTSGASTPVARLSGHRAECTSVTWSPHDQGRLASCSGELLSSLFLLFILCVFCVLNCKLILPFLFVLADDGTVRVWRLKRSLSAISSAPLAKSPSTSSSLFSVSTSASSTSAASPTQSSHPSKSHSPVSPSVSSNSDNASSRVGYSGLTSSISSSLFFSPSVLSTPSLSVVSAGTTPQFSTPSSSSSSSSACFSSSSASPSCPISACADQRPAASMDLVSAEVSSLSTAVHRSTSCVRMASTGSNENRNQNNTVSPAAPPAAAVGKKRKSSGGDIAAVAEPALKRERGNEYLDQQYCSPPQDSLSCPASSELLCTEDPSSLLDGPNHDSTVRLRLDFASPSPSAGLCMANTASPSSSTLSSRKMRVRTLYELWVPNATSDHSLPSPSLAAAKSSPHPARSRCALPPPPSSIRCVLKSRGIR